MKYSLQNKTPPVQNGIGKRVHVFQQGQMESRMGVVKLKTEKREKIRNYFCGSAGKNKDGDVFFF